MGHSYKLLVIIFRPVVILLAAFLVAKFGKKFFQRMLNGIAIFLTLFALAAGAVAFHMVQKLADPYYFATQDEVQQTMVAAVMAVLIMMIAVGYFIVADSTKNGQTSNWAKHYVGLGFSLLPCLAFMGFSLPLCIMKETAGKIVGGIIEVIAFIVAIKITKNYFKEVKEEEKNKPIEEEVE